jgi:ATP-dependent Clp protease adaptor protein ClpS
VSRCSLSSPIEMPSTASHLPLTHKNTSEIQIIAPPPIFAMSAYIIPSMAQKDSTKDGGGNTSVITRTEPKTQKPSLYKVLLLNDDYTPMEFVVHVLQTFFAKSADEATRVMLHVHQKGVGICGVYTFEIAETKVTQVMDFAKKHQQPLQCTMEKE